MTKDSPAVAFSDFVILIFLDIGYFVIRILHRSAATATTNKPNDSNTKFVPFGSFDSFVVRPGLSFFVSLFSLPPLRF